PSLPITYRDFAQWQRETARTDEDAKWWQKTLEGAPDKLELPVDRPRPPVPSFAGDRVPVTVAPAVMKSIDAVATAHRATRFMVTLAAWQIVVRALTQEDDLVVVSPTAGRQQPQTHGLVGFFVNSVFLRTRVDGGATFEQLIDATRNTCVDALDHADIPFEAIVEAT
ncbi:MAG: condensation domain-containing protein, partial [Myxococcota bacterium]